VDGFRQTVLSRVGVSDALVERLAREQGQSKDQQG
jgi:hypothetical protein